MKTAPDSIDHLKRLLKQLRTFYSATKPFSLSDNSKLLLLTKKAKRSLVTKMGQIRFYSTTQVCTYFTLLQYTVLYLITPTTILNELMNSPVCST